MQFNPQTPNHMIQQESIHENHKRLSQPLKASQMPIERINLLNHMHLFKVFLNKQTNDMVLKERILAYYKRKITTENIVLFYQTPLFEFAQALLNNELDKLIGHSASCFRSVLNKS